MSLRLWEIEGLYRSALSRDGDLVFRDAGPLARDCETFLKDTCGVQLRMESVFGSGADFAERVFRWRLHALRSALQLTLFLTLTAVGIPIYMWRLFLIAGGGAFDLTWQTPFVTLASVTASGATAAIAIAVVWMPAVLITQAILTLRGRPSMARAWKAIAGL